MFGPVKCPGSPVGGTPALKIKKCPRCGGEVEMFSTDMRVECASCGQPVFNNINSCAGYCLYAEQCLGTEIYTKLRK